MVAKILAIGANTFREAIRNKVLYSLLFFAVMIIVSSLAIGAMTVGEEGRVTMDLGLGGMSLFSVIIAIFVGVNLLYKELDKRTIYTLISKPIHRYQFILGKYLGVVWTLAVQVAVMTAVLYVVLQIQGTPVHSALAKMVVLIFLEVMVITAIALLFSSFSTPFLSGLFTMGIFVMGRSVPEIRLIAKIKFRSLSWLLKTASYVVPNLRFFYVTGSDSGGDDLSVHGTFVDGAYLLWALAYAAPYSLLALLWSMLFFSRRDFI